MFGRESTANLHALLIHLDAGAIKDVASKNFVRRFLQIPAANPLSKGIMYPATELVHQNDLKLKQYGHQCWGLLTTMCALMNILSITLKVHLQTKFGNGSSTSESVLHIHQNIINTKQISAEKFLRSFQT